MGVLHHIERLHNQGVRRLSHEQREAMKHKLRNMPLESKLAMAQALAETNPEVFGEDGGARFGGAPANTSQGMAGMKTLFGVGSDVQVAIGIGASVSRTITLASAPNSFQPTRMIVQAAFSVSGTLTGVITACTIGTDNQFASLGDLPIGMFAADATEAEIFFKAIREGKPVSVTARFDSVDVAAQKVSWNVGFYGYRLD